MQLSPSVTLESQDNQVDLLKIKNQFAEATISLFGGHVLSFIPARDSQDRLWVSANAIMDGTKSIRGGTPVCWPWFADHESNEYPAHGYVRSQNWTVLSCTDTKAGTVIELKPESTNGEGFDGNADLTLKVTVGDSLTMALTTTNQGSEPMTFNAALHTYFSTSDINRTELVGLSGDYLDKTCGYERKTTAAPYLFQSETDNIHLNPVPKAIIKTPDFDTTVSSEGHDSIVVWNPWIERSTNMKDMLDDGYQTMLCVESAVTQGKTLAPGESHTLTQVVGSE